MHYMLLYMCTQRNIGEERSLYLMMTEQGKRGIMISRVIFAISYKTKKNSFGKVCIRLFFGVIHLHKSGETTKNSRLESNLFDKRTKCT